MAISCRMFTASPVFASVNRSLHFSKTSRAIASPCSWGSGKAPLSKLTIHKFSHPRSVPRIVHQNQSTISDANCRNDANLPSKRAIRSAKSDFDTAKTTAELLEKIEVALAHNASDRNDIDGNSGSQKNDDKDNTIDDKAAPKNDDKKNDDKKNDDKKNDDKKNDDDIDDKAAHRLGR